MVFWYLSFLKYLACQKFKPILTEIIDQYKDRFTFVKVNLDTHKDIFVKFDISTIPTFVLFNDGFVTARVTGASKTELISLLNPKV